MRSNRQIHVLARSLAASLAAIAVVACNGATTDKAGGVERTEPTVLTFANIGGLNDQISAYASEVERLSNGTLRIEFTANWRDGEPAQEQGLIGDVQAGRVDMGWVGARAFESVGVTSFQALLAPFLIDSYDLEARVFDDDIPARMLDSVDAVGLTGLGVLPGPMRKMMGISHPFVRPSDFVGEVVGTSGGTLAERSFRALGATPKLVPAMTSLNGLDALDYQLGAIFGNRYFENAIDVTANVNLWPRPLVIIMDTDRYDALTADQQHILKSAAASTVDPALAASRADDAFAEHGLCRTDITIVQANASDLTALDMAVEPVYTELEQTPGTSVFLDEIRSLKEQTGGPAESFTCVPGVTPVDAAKSTPIDGVYQVTTTADQGRAAGDLDPVPENYGAWTYVFDRGRFAFTQDNRPACTWGYGTYEVTGDRVEWSFLDGGGISPNNAENKPGEFFVFGWSVFRDVLTLTAVPGKISPSNFLLRPWHLTGTKPSRGALSARCPPPAGALWPDNVAPDSVTPTGGT
jgi:TRAP-type C4-dicarboxylate transport system substrate-binding protein